MKVFSEYNKDGKDGRLILTGMIVNKQVLGMISQKWTMEGLFDIPFMDRIAGWSVSHYNKFHKAPGNSIQNYYDRWIDKTNRKTDEYKEIESFLSVLSEEYITRERKTIQADYILKVAEDLFTKVKARNLAKQLKDLADSGEVSKIEELVRKYNKIEMTDDEMIDILENEEAINTAWDQKDEVLVEYPGAAGKFFGNRLRRKAFVAFFGPEKIGKSYWIEDVVWRGMQQGRKIAYFEVGDLTREDIILRLAARARGKPLDLDEYTYPLSIEASMGKGKVTVQLETRQETELPSKELIKRIFQKKVDKYGSGLLKVSCSPARSLTVNGIIAKLDKLQSQQDWVPDIVAIDYVDIMAPINGTAETRDQINLTWIMLRALSMSHSCLVLTATQTNRGSYDSEIIGMEHASDDKRKWGHVTAAFGLNQTDEEKDEGIYRINIPAGRTGKSSRTKCLHTVGSLAISNPCILSSF